MLDIDIVDPHHHLWDLAAVRHPWLQEAAGELAVHGDDAALRQDFLPADYRAAFADLRVVRTVHVDAGAADGVLEAQWLETCATEDGLPDAIVASVALDAPDAEQRLEQVAALPHVRGIRHILNWHPEPGLSYTDRPDIMLEPGFRKAFGRLAGLALSFDLQVYPDQLEQSARLAQEHPETAVVLNHTGMPLGRDDQAIHEWRAGMRALAAQGNCTVKISGLGMTDHRWTTDSIRLFVLDTVEIFGVDRCMFASNFPVDGLYSTASELYAAFDELTSTFSTEERRALFADNADRVYRLLSPTE